MFNADTNQIVFIDSAVQHLETILTSLAQGTASSKWPMFWLITPGSTPST